jgi:hypothetical protein
MVGHCFMILRAVLEAPPPEAVFFMEKCGYGE